MKRGAVVVDGMMNVGDSWRFFSSLLVSSRLIFFLPVSSLHFLAKLTKAHRIFCRCGPLVFVSIGIHGS